MTLNVTFVFIRQRCLRDLLNLYFPLHCQVIIHSKFRRSHEKHFWKLQIWITHQVSRKPKKPLLVVIIRFWRDILILYIIFRRKVIDFAFSFRSWGSTFPTEDYWDVSTNTHKIAMPVGYAFVGHGNGHIKRDNCTLPLDTVNSAKFTKFFVSDCIS